MVFGFLKKKKKAELDMPMPPKPPKIDSDLPEISFPEIPQEEEIPDFSIPETKEEDIPQASDFMEEKEEQPEFNISRDFDSDVAEKFAPSREEVLIPRIKPMFVAIDEYSQLMESSNLIRSKLVEAEDYVERLNEIKNQEKKNFEKWQAKLEDIEKKISYIDKVIANSQGGNES